MYRPRPTCCVQVAGFQFAATETVETALAGFGEPALNAARAMGDQSAAETSITGKAYYETRSPTKCTSTFTKLRTARK